MINILIFILTPFKRIFNRSGIDFDRMITIARYRLIVDGRKSLRGYAKEKKGEEVNSAQLKTALSMMFSISLLFLVLSSQVADFQTLLLIYHSLLMLMMLSTIMSEYSGFIFDNQDNQILMRMPVNSKTIWSAKFCCMLFYFMFYAFAGAIIPSVVIAVKYGFLHGVMLLISSFFNVGFALLFVNLLFLVLTRFVSADKYQKIINGVQMVVVVVVLLCYMFINNFVDDGTLSLDPGRWSIIIPPLWFAAFNLILANTDTLTIFLLIEGVITPLVATYGILKWFAPYLSGRIMETDQSSFYSEKIRKRSGYMSLMSSIFTRKPLSKAGFEFSWNLSSGNKLYFEMVMPMVAYTIVFSVIQILMALKGSAEDSLMISISSIMSLYFTFFAAYAIVDSMQYTRNSSLLWFFQSKPIDKPGIFLIGAFKGIYIKYFMPIFLPLALINLYFMGVANIFHIWFAFAAVTITVMLQLKIMPLFPFSKERERMTSGKYFVIIILIMAAAAIMAVIQYYLAKLSWGMEIASLIFLILLYLTGKSFYNISWNRIIKQY